MQLVRAMEVGSFASFLSKKKRQYAAVYPFLRADQIEAKLRRIWTNKKAHCAGKGESALSRLKGHPAKVNLKGASKPFPQLKQASVFDVENVPPPESTIRAPTPKLVKSKPLAPANTFSPPRVSVLKCSNTHPLPTVALRNGSTNTKPKLATHSYNLRNSSTQCKDTPLSPQAASCSRSNGNHGVLVANTATKHPLEDSLTADDSTHSCLAKNMEGLHVCSEGTSASVTPARHVRWQSPNTVHEYTPTSTTHDSSQDSNMELQSDGGCVEVEHSELLPPNSASLLSPAVTVHTGPQRRVNQNRPIKNSSEHSATSGSTFHQSVQSCSTADRESSVHSVTSSRSSFCEESPVGVTPQEAPMQVWSSGVTSAEEGPRPLLLGSCMELGGEGSVRRYSRRLYNKQWNNRRIDLSESLPDALSSQNNSVDVNTSVCSLPTSLYTAAATHRRKRRLCDLEVPVRMTGSVPLETCTHEAEKRAFKDSLFEETYGDTTLSQDDDQELSRSFEPSVKKSRLWTPADEVMGCCSENASRAAVTGGDTAPVSSEAILPTPVYRNGSTEAAASEASLSDHPLEMASLGTQLQQTSPQACSSKDGVMCDLFSPIPPGRKVVNAYSFCLAAESSSIERRVCPSATAAEGHSSFYTMFTDDSDIFM